MLKLQWFAFRSIYLFVCLLFINLFVCLFRWTTQNQKRMMILNCLMISSHLCRTILYTLTTQPMVSASFKATSSLAINYFLSDISYSIYHIFHIWYMKLSMFPFSLKELLCCGPQDRFIYDQVWLEELLIYRWLNLGEYQAALCILGCYLESSCLLINLLSSFTGIKNIAHRACQSKCECLTRNFWSTLCWTLCITDLPRQWRNGKILILCFGVNYH